MARGRRAFPELLLLVRSLTGWTEGKERGWDEFHCGVSKFKKIRVSAKKCYHFISIIVFIYIYI